MKYKRKSDFLKSLPLDIRKTIPAALLAVFACFAFAAVLNARSSRQRQFEIKIENLTEENRQKAVRLLRKLDKACSRIAEPPPGITPLKLRVMFVNEKLRERIKIITLRNGCAFAYLPADTKEWITSQDLLKKLLKTMLLCKCGFPPDRPNADIPDWILSGLLRKAEALEDGIKVPGVKVYPGLHTLAASGKFPDLTESLNRKLKRTHGNANKLNLEICELLVNSCAKMQTPKEKPFYETIVLTSNKKNTPAEIFKKTFGKIILSKKLVESNSPGKTDLSIPEEARMNEWFQKEIRKASINFLMPASPEYSEKIFFEALNVHDGNSVYPLEEMPQKIESMDNKNLLALSLAKNLNDIQNDLPPECRGCAIKIIAELENFRMGKTENFTENVKAARKAFSQITGRMRKINKLLKRYEKKNIPPYERYSNYFRELSEIEREKRTRNKELNKCLDRVEKEFDKEWK